MVHVCLAVTCHLYFWQNDRDLLRATVVTHVRVQMKFDRHHFIMFVLQAHPKTATDALEELSSLLQVPLVVSAFFS